MPHDPQQELETVRRYKDFVIYLMPGDVDVDPYLLLERNGDTIDIPLADLRHVIDKLAMAGGDLAALIVASNDK